MPPRGREHSALISDSPLAKTTKFGELIPHMPLVTPRRAPGRDAQSPEMKRPWIFAVALVFRTVLIAGEINPDQQARFLAGLPVSDAALEPLVSEDAWQRHQREFDESWKKLEAGQVARIRSWAPLTLANDATSRDPLFYMFSGPDFLYANTFFPNASTYVFCGLEAAGSIPDVGALPRGGLAAALANLRKSLNAVLSFSFFLTKEMKVDLRATQLSGALPVLYVFIARTGNTIRSTELVRLNDNGDLAAEGAPTPGVKIVFSCEPGPEQTLYYFSTDLSNDGIRRRPGFMRFCAKLGSGNSLVKAASYLMHMDEFSDVRGFLLANSKTLVEDDSGIPYRFFAPEEWDVLVLGRYPGPIKMFENRFQSDLSRAFKAANPPGLTFSFGYRWHPNESSLIVATSINSVPKALPAAN